MDIAISSCEQGTFQGSRVNFGFLRLYANGYWVDSEGVQHVGGAVDSNQFFEEFDVTIDSDGIIHIPSINIQTTTDAVDNPNVRITAAIYTGNRKTHSSILVQNVFIPTDQAPSTTWENIREANQATQAESGLPPTWWTLVQGLFNTVSQGARDASRVIIGITKLSTDPVSAANPIAVGDNDARVNTVNVAQYSTFSAAVDAVAALPGTLNFLDVTTAISTGAKTVPADVKLISSNSKGTLTCTSGVVTVLGPIDLPPNLFFIEAGGTFDLSDSTAEHFYHEWYGTDTAAKLQWLIDQRKGGNANYSTTIQLVQGTDYTHATPLDWDDTFGMSVKGAGGSTYLQNGYVYTGSGSSTAHSMMSMFGCTFTGLSFKYTHASMTGFLIEGGFAGYADTADNLFLGCRFTGTTTAYQAKALVCFNGSILNVIDQCAFEYAQKGYQGQRTSGDGTQRQSVRNSLLDCQFNNCGIHYFNCGESFYGRANHQANTQSLGGSYVTGDNRIFSSDGTTTTKGVTIVSGWAGDGVVADSTYTLFDLKQVIGGVFCGGFADGTLNNVSPHLGAYTTLVSFNACEDVSFGEGMFVSNCDKAVVFDTGASRGVRLLGRLGATVTAPQYVNGGTWLTGTTLGGRTYENTVRGGLTVEGASSAFANNQGVNVGLITSNGTRTTDAQIGVASGASGATNNDLLITAPYNGGECGIALNTYDPGVGTSWVNRLRILAAGITAKAHLLFSADNTYDIGAVGATRPRTGYFGTSVITPLVSMPVNGSVTINSNRVVTENGTVVALGSLDTLLPVAFDVGGTEVARLLVSGNLNSGIAQHTFGSAVGNEDVGIVRASAGVLKVTDGGAGTGALTVGAVTAGVTTATSVAVGSGTAITKIVKGSVTIDPASVAANTVAAQTFTLTGAVVGDTLILNCPTAGLTAGLLVSNFFVSAADTVSVTFNNTTGAPIDQASATWFYTLIRA